MADRFDERSYCAGPTPRQQPRYRKGIAPTKVTVSAEGRLVDVVSEEYCQRWSMTQKQLQAAIEQACQRGDIVDRFDNPLPSDTMLCAGESIYLHREAADECDIDALEVLWSNEAAMIVNKPGWISTIPRGSYIARSVVIAARRQFHNDTIIAAHRLDRLTSGCLLLVCQPQYRSRYQLLFQHGKVNKTYRALTDAWPLAVHDHSVLTTSQKRKPNDNQPHTIGWVYPGQRFCWRLPMYKPTGSLITHIADASTQAPSRKNPIHETVTEAQVATQFECNGRHMLEWQLRPLTGFTHQLRVALYHQGYPIVGDPLYPRILPAEDKKNVKPQMGLHAQSLAFIDPLSGENVSVSAPKPAWWP